MAGLETCTDCGERITLGLVSAEPYTKTEKTYAGDVRTVGDRVKARIGLACGCRTYANHPLTHNVLDASAFDVKPDTFPADWVGGDN